MREAVMVLHSRLEKVEKRLDRLDGKRRRIGFQSTDVPGDRIPQDEDEPEIEEIP